MQQLKIHFTPIDTVYACQTVSMLNNIQNKFNDADAILAVAKRMYRLQNRCIQQHLLNHVVCSENDFVEMIQDDYQFVHAWIDTITQILFDYESRQTK
mgnify:CR=1 FL=1